MQSKVKYSLGLIAALVLGAGASAASAQPAPAGQSSLTPPPPAGRSAGDLALWRASYIDEKGAVPLGATDAAMEYAVAGSYAITGAGTVKGWMRWEQFAPVATGQGDARSAMQLLEVDCQGGRGRLLALDVYPYNNLKGTARHLDAQDPQWTYARPGTVLEQNVGLLCAAAKSAVTAAILQARNEQGGAPTLPQAPATALASAR